MMLIVEDDPELGRTVERLVAPLGPTKLATTVQDAKVALEADPPPSGVILDLTLPDGTGLELAAEVREKRPEMPILILTAHNEPEFINQAHALGAEYVCKPFFGDNIKQFVRRMLARHVLEGERKKQYLEVFARQYNLSPRETQIVSLSLSGVPRRRLATELGVSENTLKTQIRSLLQKCGEDSLAETLVRFV